MRSFILGKMVLLLVLAGCGAAAEGDVMDDGDDVSFVVHRDEVAPDFVFSWWASPELEGEAEAIEKGAAYWRAADIVFERTDIATDADLWLYYGDRERCVLEDADENDVLLGVGDGESGTVLLCIENVYELTELDASRVPEIVAHEIGHVLGVGHLAKRCGVEGEDAVHLYDADGNEICGDAIMNPYIGDESVSRLTDLDVAAFAVRDEEDSIIPPSVDADAQKANVGSTEGDQGHPCYAHRAR